MLTQCSRDQVVFDLWVVFRDNVTEQLDSLGGTVVPILEKSAPTPFNWSGISTAIQHFTKPKNGFGAVGDFECLRIMESRFAIFVEQPVVIAFDREYGIFAVFANRCAFIASVGSKWSNQSDSHG